MSKAVQPVNKMHIGTGKERVSAKMRATLEFMASEGLGVKQAAVKAGMKEESAMKAFRKPHIKRLYNQMAKDVIDGAAQAAHLRINHTSKTAASEHVRLEANKWVAGVGGISPVQKVQGQHHHSHQFGGFEYDDPRPVDVTPSDYASAADDE